MLKIKTWLARRYDLRQLGHWFRGRWPKLFNGTSLQHFSPRVVVTECRYNRGKLNVSCCFASFFFLFHQPWMKIDSSCIANTISVLSVLLFQSAMAIVWAELCCPRGVGTPFFGRKFAFVTLKLHAPWRWRAPTSFYCGRRVMSYR